MRIRVIVLYAVLFLAAPAACSADRVEQPPPPPVNIASLHEPLPGNDEGDKVSEKERALPQVYASALASPGLAGLAPVLDEDVHFVSPGMDDTHGRAAIVRAHDFLFGAFDDRKVAMSRVWRTASQQTIEWTMTGTQARDWMGVPAKRKPVSFKGLTLLWTKDDGSITDVHVYFDAVVVKAQLGVGPKELVALPPPAPPTGSPDIHEQQGSDQEKKEVELVKSQLNALQKSDGETAYLGAMADNVDVYTLERAAPAHGKEDAKTYFRATRRAIGQIDTTVDNAWGVGEFAIVEYYISGEQLGPIGWIPTQRDKVFRLHLVDVCEIKDGKLARVWRYDNPGQILGVVRPPEVDAGRAP